MVVRVGHHALEDREFRAVAVGDALVAKRPAEVVDVLQAPDDAAVQEQLDRDAQVQVDVQRVVMRRERARGGAAGECLQHRRLDLREAFLAQDLVDRLDHLRAFEEHLARLGVRQQVELAIAVARAEILHPVVTVRRRAQRLGQQRALDHAERELPALGDVHVAVDADDVADVEAQHVLVGLLAHRLLARDELHRAGLVAHVEERRLRVIAPGGQAPADAVGQRRMSAGLHVAGYMRRLELRDPRARDLGLQVGVGVVSLGAHALHLRPPFIRADRLALRRVPAVRGGRLDRERRLLRWRGAGAHAAGTRS